MRIVARDQVLREVQIDVPGRVVSYLAGVTEQSRVSGTSFRDSVEIIASRLFNEMELMI